MVVPIEPLSRRRDFEALRESGGRFQGEVVRVVSVQGEGGSVRLAIAASRRTGSAVERNKFRRRVREAVRNVGLYPGTYLVIPQIVCSEISFAEITSDLTRLVARASGSDGSTGETGVA